MVLVMGGCSVTPEPEETTPAFATEEEAFAAAEQTYRAYVDALNQVDLSDPETFEPVFALTTGELNTSDRRGLSTYHADQVAKSGESTITDLQRESADLENGIIHFSVCLDVSTVELTELSGESIVDPDRVPVQSLRVTVEGPRTAAGSLQVSSVSGRSGEPVCD
ncbi:hypothetical protein DEA06_13090 [Microbacterium sp. Gd 4-13]|nr:hypothetical protein DEA06_13090 [Microbacterium sp. Gd 4-13]